MSKQNKTAVSVLRLGRGGYMLGSSSDLNIGEPCLLLSEEGKVIRTSPVEGYRIPDGKGLVVYTRNSEYQVKREF